MSENTAVYVDTDIDETIVDEVEQDVTEVDETEESGTFSIEELARDIVSDMGDEISPYKIATVVNTVLEALGAEKRVRPQMTYNYDVNGLIVKGVKGKKKYTRDEVVAWVTKYATKHAA